MNAYELACTQPWAIKPDALEGILAIAGRIEVTPKMIVALHGYEYDAVEAKRGRKVDDTDNVTYRNGVAIIPVDGSIVRRADFFSSVSGAVSVNSLARDFTAALRDESVQAILFNIDSPGGEVNGINELADMIYAARKTKPIHAYISHLGASAAYWIASACSEIVADATSQVGSIGVVGTMPNPEKDAKRTVEFISSQSPHKRPNIATEGGRAQVQARVDALADVFVAAVARNRKVSQAIVLKDFGGGGMFVGKDAVKAGLVDKIGSFEATLAALVAGQDDVADSAAKDTGGTIVAEEQEQ
jgi:signal peptide peptidase SppA